MATHVTVHDVCNLKTEMYNIVALVKHIYTSCEEKLSISQGDVIAQHEGVYTVIFKAVIECNAEYNISSQSHENVT